MDVGFASEHDAFPVMHRVDKFSIIGIIGLVFRMYTWYSSLLSLHDYTNAHVPCVFPRPRLPVYFTYASER